MTTVNVTVVAGAARDTASNNNTASAAVAVVYGKLVVGCVHGIKKISKDAAGCSRVQQGCVFETTIFSLETCRYTRA